LAINIKLLTSFQDAAAAHCLPSGNKNADIHDKYRHFPLYPGISACRSRSIPLSGIYLMFIRKFPVIADQGRSGAFEEIVIRLHGRIPKTGKALETSKSSDQ